MQTLLKKPVTIITGFLGAGKTTLIQKITQHTPASTRYAFIINEFGAVDIDAQTISEHAGCAQKKCLIQELPNGCICCTIEEDFMPAMELLTQKANEIDHVIIETSGLALPKPLIEAFNWPAIKRHFKVNATIAVIDAQAAIQNKIPLPNQPNPQFTLKHQKATEELFSDQIICADIVLLNKLETLTETHIQNLKNRITPLLQPGAKILHNHQNATHIAELIDPQINTTQDITQIHTHHDHHHHDNQQHTHAHDNFKHHLLQCAPMPKPALETLITQLSGIPSVYRIKGYAAITESPMRLNVQTTTCNQNLHFDKLWPQNQTPRTNLVIIAEHNDNDNQRIQALIAQCT